MSSFCESTNTSALNDVPFSASISESDSVTLALRKRYGFEVNVLILWQGWQNLPFFLESVWVRDVLLFTANMPQVLARVIVPKKTLYSMPWLKRMGRRPLGSVLYRNYQPQRLVLEEKKITLHQAMKPLRRLARSRVEQSRFGVLFKEIESSQGLLLQRKSLMSIPNSHNSPSNVCEIFFIESFFDGE